MEDTLLSETLERLLENKKSASEVKWVGTPTKWFSWEHFTKIADREYDSSYGTNEVYRELLVVGDDWWLERGEYDGSEWWDFKTLPVKPATNYEPKNLFLTRKNYSYPDIED